MRNFILIAVAVIAIGAIVFLLTNKSQQSQIPASAQPQDHANLANPASINCEKQGGQTVIMKNGNGGEFGLCQFEDDMACEEWALYRGQCPVGGVKTTGFDTIAQKYCAWVGGQTLAVENAQCTLPDGTVCSDEELYNAGQCPTQ